VKSPTKECHIKCKKKSDHHSGVLGKLFDGLNGNFIHAESRICIKEHFFSLGKPFLRWFWPFSLLAWSRKCSEFDRASNELQFACSFISRAPLVQEILIFWNYARPFGLSVYRPAYPDKLENHHDLLDTLHSVHFLELPNRSKWMKFAMVIPE